MSNESKVIDGDYSILSGGSRDELVRQLLLQ